MYFHIFAFISQTRPLAGLMGNNKNVAYEIYNKKFHVAYFDFAFHFREIGHQIWNLKVFILERYNWEFNTFLVNVNTDELFGYNQN